SYLVLMNFLKEAAPVSGPRLHLIGSLPFWPTEDARPLEISGVGDSLVQILRGMRADKLWQVRAAEHDERMRIAAVSAPEGGQEKVVAIVERQDRSIWTCIRSYKDIKQGLLDWSKDNVPEERRLTAERAKQIDEDGSRMLLLEVLTAQGVR